jgi:hypothetical protein
MIMASNSNKKTYQRFKQTWAIIKHRRRSFAILCTFGIALDIVYLTIYHWNALLMFIPIIIMILYAIFSLGFLRSIYLYDIREQPFRSLFGLGKQFFWREFGAGLLLLLCWGVILLPGVIAFELLDIEDYGIWPRPTIFLGRVLLIKLFLFVPMLIIVLDCSIRKAFGSLKHISIRNAIHLAVLSLGISLLGDLNGYLSPKPEHYRLIDYARTLIISIAATIMYLIIQIETIQVIVGTSKVGQVNVSTTNH